MSARVAEMHVAWVLPLPSPAALRAVVADVRARSRRVAAQPVRT
jgi:hypothetical protein